MRLLVLGCVLAALAAPRLRADAPAPPAERVARAMDFRESLVGSGRVRLVGRLLEALAERHPTPLADRPALDRFAVSAERFVRQLRGETPIDPEAAFGPFAGRWYGVWDGKRVDHHWSGVGLSSPGAPSTSLVATQTAWVGDGWGWNYVVRVAPESTFVRLAGEGALGPPGMAVLGYVEMLTHQDPGGDRSAVRGSFPLVGYYDGPGRLIWVTPTVAFFEQTLSYDGQPAYAITGFEYEDTPRGGLRTRGGGFQAVYTRDPDRRPRWLRFDVACEVSADATPRD